MFYGFINWYIINKLCYWKIFDPVVLVVVNIISQVLFYCLIESFYLFVCLKVKSYKKLIVYSKFRNECCKELRGKDRTFICYKFVWQFIVVNDLLDNDICKIFCWIGFVDRYEFTIFDKTIYYDEDIVIANIVDGVLRFR